jgi:hypothetical protein
MSLFEEPAIPARGEEGVDVRIRLLVGNLVQLAQTLDQLLARRIFGQCGLQLAS